MGLPLPLQPPVQFFRVAVSLLILPKSVHASVEETAVSPSLALSCLSCPGVLRSWPYIKGAPLDKKLVVVDETVAVTTTVLASQLHSTQARIDKKLKL